MARALTLLAAWIAIAACNAPTSSPEPAPPARPAPTTASPSPPPRAIPDAAPAPPPPDAPRPAMVMRQGIMSDLAFLPERDQLLALSWDGVLAGNTEEERALNRVQIWDLGSRTVSATPSGMGTIRAMSLALDAKRVVTLNMEGQLSLRALPSFDAKWTIDAGNATDASITRDGRVMLTGDDKGIIRLYDGLTGKLQWTKKVLAEYVMDLEISPSGRYVAVGGNEKVVTVFDGRTRTVAARLATAVPTEDRYGGIYSLAFSPDEKWLATGGADDVMRVFSLPSGKLAFSRKAGQPNALAWSPDSTALAWAGNYDGPDIKVVTMKDGSVITFPSEHDLMVNTLAWSPDGTQILSGGRDKTIRVHALQNRRPSSGP